MPLVPRLTLGQVLVLGAAGIAVLLAALLFAFLESSRRSILQTSHTLRAAAARRVEEQVRRELGEAERALENVEREIRSGSVDVDDLLRAESALFNEIIDNPRLAEATFTRAARLGYDEAGAIVLAAEGRWQLSVHRASADPDSSVLTRRVSGKGERFGIGVRARPPGGGFLGAPFRSGGAAPDPTEHPTFRAAAGKSNAGRAIWTDLAYSQFDAELPEEKRRVIVSVQKAIEDGAGRFAGVLRVGILAQTVDDVARLKVNQNDPDDPHRIFLCDDQGRLITRLGPGDRLREFEDDLRVQPTQVPPSVAKALESTMRGEMSPGDPERSGELEVAGTRYLVTFGALADTQDWLVGIVVPEDYYTHDLSQLRRRSLAAGLLVLALVVAAGAGGLRALRRGLGRISETATRMRNFDFAPAQSSAPFRDVQEVAESLEQAKTALRALGKYAPVDLVRQLYQANREPILGGELLEVSIMFTDIAGFTALAERLSPDTLAQALGRYFEAMTAPIRAAGGTIDKFIGDAVMAIWNAPTPREGHARLACRAALGCLEATRALYASADWAGLPPLRTRFGLHRDRVMVGHFGSPERLSYTALGDGVNLAARLESLCKQYGVAVLASEAVEEEARAEFQFRLVDRVAVKGKTIGVRVYELLGERGASSARPEVVEVYERAFAAYLQWDFQGAIALLTLQAGDPPSAVLLERCRKLAESPPPPGWDGIYTATAK